jgi:hypothetical protein
MDPIYFPTPADFRAWLEQNHSKAEALRVGFYKKRTGQPIVSRRYPAGNRRAWS